MFASFDTFLSQAESLAQETDDRGSFYALGEHYESKGVPQRAVSWFTRAGSRKRAIRLAMENNMDADVTSLALQSSPDVQLEAAQLRRFPSYVSGSPSLC